MKTEIENAIVVLAKKITNPIAPDEALKFTQATLNLAHVLSILKNNERNTI